MSTIADVTMQLRDALGGRVEEHARSDELTTYRCGGPLAALVHIERADELTAVSHALTSAPAVDVLVIGRGSNLLIADRGFDGLALVLGGELEECTIDAATARVTAGA